MKKRWSLKRKTEERRKVDEGSSRKGAAVEGIATRAKAGARMQLCVRRTASRPLNGELGMCRSLGKHA